MLSLFGPPCMFASKLHPLP